MLAHQLEVFTSKINLILVGFLEVTAYLVDILKHSFAVLEVTRNVDSQSDNGDVRVLRVTLHFIVG